MATPLLLVAAAVVLGVGAQWVAWRTRLLDEGVVDALERSGLGWLLAVTPNDEVNSLAALHFGEVFQIPVRSEGPQSAASPPTPPLAPTPGDGQTGPLADPPRATPPRP